MSTTDKNGSVALASFSAERLAQIRDDHEFKTGDCLPGSPWQKDPDIEDLCDEVLRLQGVERDLRASTPEGHRARLTLAASRGVLSALTSDESLGEAARGYGMSPRTLEGDAFETAFEWARQLKRDGDVAVSSLPCVTAAIRAARAKALEDAATLLLRTRCREWSVAECALAVRTADHPAECSCHRWVDCGRPA